MVKSPLGFVYGCGIAVLCASAFARPLAAATILSDSFARGTSGSQLPLNGSNPDVGTGPWVAASSFTTDGTEANQSATPNNTSAFLPFVPQAGNVYTYSLALNPAAGTSTNWLAFGFTNGTPTTSSFNTNNAVLWMLERDNRGLQSFFGGNTAGASTPATTGDAGFTTFQIVLDTTTPLWGFAFEKNGTVFRSGSFASNPTITDVGMGNIANMTGSYQSLSVTSVPEPACLGLFLVGGLGLMTRRRTA